MGPRKGHVPVGHALLLFRIFPPPLHLSHRHPVDLVHTYAVPASQRGLTTHEVLYKRLLNHNSFPWLFFGTTTCLPGSFSQLLVLSIVLLRRVWALKFNKLKSQVSHERTRALQVNRPYFKPQISIYKPWGLFTYDITYHTTSIPSLTILSYDHHIGHKTSNTGPDLQHTFKGQTRSLLFISLEFLK